MDLGDYISNFINNFNNTIRELKRICGRTASKHPFDMWIIENFSIVDQRWDKTPALIRCLKRTESGTSCVNVVVECARNFMYLDQNIDLKFTKLDDYKREDSRIIHIPTQESIRINPESWVSKTNEAVFWMYKLNNCFVDHTGAGFQFAFTEIPNNYIEAFGSPFNTVSKKYFSAFPIVDKYFGSSGSFFSVQLLTGNAVVNPPFTEEVLLKTFEIIEKSITKNKIRVIFITPKWDDCEAIKRAKASKYCRSIKNITSFKYKHKLVVIPGAYKFILSYN